MSRQYNEGTNGSVSGPSCSYASLSQYNKGSDGMQPPRPAGALNGYIVPVYGSSGYASVQLAGDGTCSGYPSIGSAYRNSDGQCNQQYVRKLCN